MLKLTVNKTMVYPVTIWVKIRSKSLNGESYLAMLVSVTNLVALGGNLR